MAAKWDEARRRPNTTCDLCAKPIYRRPGLALRNAAKFCSKACRNKVYKQQCFGVNPKKGLPLERNPAWKGGVTIFKKHGNYKNVRYVRAPDWAQPMARADGYIMEHRLVMADWCGFLLTRQEVVHHVNHDPSQNQRLNLELWPDNRSHKLAEHGRFVEGAANRFFPGVSARRSSPPGNRLFVPESR